MEGKILISRVEKGHDVMFSIRFNGHANKVTEIGILKLTEKGSRIDDKQSQTLKC